MSKKSQYYKLLSSYGQMPRSEFTYEEYESVSHYFRNKVKNTDEFYIDDITWNDLDLDKIFLMMNHTHSAVGRDYLYKLLRTPTADQKELSERERLIGYFDGHEKQRTEIMQAFSEIGFTRKISVSDHMARLFSLKAASNVPHILNLLCILIAVLFMILIDPVFGIMLLLVAVGISITSYYKTKSRIDSFFTCIRQLVAMLRAARKIASFRIDALSVYNDRLKKSYAVFHKIVKGAWLLSAGKEKGGSLVEIVLEYVRIFTHIDLMKFNSMLKKIGSHPDEAEELMDCLGYLESMIGIASFRRLLPYYCLPEFSERNAGMDITQLYHLCIANPVANSIREARPVLVTGSNASGKSTFLKSTAIAAILAQTVHTVPAERYAAPFYRIYTSMAISDSLETQESYYIVEIRSLKRIVDAAHGKGARVLCFIDEVLRGTNTVERIAASGEILKNLAQAGVMCFAATHDIELTQMLSRYYANYHFTEEIYGGQIRFSYILHHGESTSRNAIRLLELIGYEDAIIQSSQQSADDFVNTGTWRRL